MNLPAKSLSAAEYEGVLAHLLNDQEPESYGPWQSKNRWRTTAATATFPEAVRENNEEVVPVNAVSTWVLPSGVMVGR